MAAPVITSPADDPHSESLEVGAPGNMPTIEFTGDELTEPLAFSGPDAALFNSDLATTSPLGWGFLDPPEDGSYDVTTTLTNGSGTDSVRWLLTVEAPATPVNTVAPAVSGFHYLGKTLTSDRGTWTNTPTSYADVWQRANDGSGTGAANIALATIATYVVVGADSGKWLRTGTTASNAAGAGTITYSAWMYVYPVVSLPTPTLIARNLVDPLAADGHFLFDETTSDVANAAVPASLTWKNEAPQNAWDFSAVAIASDYVALTRRNGCCCVKISPHCGLHGAHGGVGTKIYFKSAAGTEITRDIASSIGISGDLVVSTWTSPILDADIPPMALLSPSAFASIAGYVLFIEADRHLNRHSVSHPDAASASVSVSATTADITEAGDSGKPAVAVNGTRLLLMLAAAQSGGSSVGGTNYVPYLAEIAAVLNSVGDTMTLVGFIQDSGVATSPARSPAFSPARSPAKPLHS